MRWFEEILKPGRHDVLLDVGGYPATWQGHPQKTAKIVCLNLGKPAFDSEKFPEHCIETVAGDGCELPFEDHSFDIVFSNSVIEHVGDWDAQRKFAIELSRVGKRLWIQTPAFACPLEPHFLAPFVHWLPVCLRRHVVRWMTPWGWMTRPDLEKVDKTIAHTQLLKRRQLETLFPDCNILTERLLMIFPKSYVVYRMEPPRTTVSSEGSDNRPLS